MLKLERKNKSMKERMLIMNIKLDEFKNEYVKLKESHDRLDEDNDFLRYENGKLRDENENLCKGHKALSFEVAKVRKEIEENKIANVVCDDKSIKEL